MSILGFLRYVYVDDVFVGCVRTASINRTQPTSDYRVKQRYSEEVNGLQRDQIDDESLTLELAGLIAADYSNDALFTSWMKSKQTRAVEIRFENVIGAKNTKFNAYLENYASNDEGLQDFTGTVQSDGVITDGTVVAPPLFIFATQKVGTVNITTSGNNTFTDGNGNPLTMPYERSGGDSELIYMYGDTIDTLTDIAAVNCQLIGDYDFSGFTALQNADFEGNAFDSLTFVDSQFNTGTLNVINSLAEGSIFSNFIQSFNSVMVTNRASTLQIGTINDPAMLEAGTPEYNAIQSLILKGWNVTVTANRLFTATIEGTKTITPTATFSGVGSVLYQLNGLTVSSVSNSNSDANSFTVQSGDTLTCWYSNNTNDYVGLESIDVKTIGCDFINFEKDPLENDIVFRIDENPGLKSNISIVLQDIESKTTNGICKIVLTESIDITSVFFWNDGDAKSGNYQKYCDYLEGVTGVEFRHHMSINIQGSAIDFTSTQTEPYFEVDWGDGTVNKNTTHSYSNNNTYDVKVLGSINLGFFNSSYKTNVRGLNYLGRSQNTLSRTFENCINLTYAILDDGNKVISLNSAFRSCNSLVEYPNFENLDSLVTLTECFLFNTGLTTFPTFDHFKNVSNSTSMFNGCINIVGAVPSFSQMTSLVNASSMFNNCRKITSITDLNIPSLVTGTSMFRDAIELTSLPSLDTLTSLQLANNMFRGLINVVGSVDLSTVMLTATNWGNTFQGCSKLGTDDGVTPVYNITETWSNPPNTNLPNVTNSTGCFNDTNFLNQSSIPSNWK